MSNILIVTNGFPPSAYGGVEIYTFDLMQGLLKKGHTVSVFCRESDFSRPDFQVTEANDNGARVIRVINDYKKIASLRETFINEKIDHIFREYLLTIKPDIIHFNHFTGLSAQLPRIAADLQIPSITTLHDFWPICHRVNLINWQDQSCPGPQNGVDCFTCVNGGPEQQTFSPTYIRFIKLVKTITTPRFRRWMRQIIFPKTRTEAQPPAIYLSREIFQERYELHKRAILSSKRILAPSEFVRTQFTSNGYPTERISFIPLGVSTGKPDDAPTRRTDVIVFAAIGSVLASKGLHVLIKAFSEVPAKNIQLLIFGRRDASPAYTRQLERMASDDKRIIFMGPFSPDQRNNIINQIDVLVVPSAVPESFSLVAREALLHGKPVIASQIGALPEVIVDRVNGFLFTPGQVEELKMILSKIANNPDVLLELECPGPVPIYTIEDHVRVLENLYYEVLAGQ
jgi:glycosyltransferase involved in cell wall biosynthesis